MQDNWFEYDRENLKIGIIIPKKLPLIIRKEDVEISFFSGGPGGQNVNRNMNGIRLIFHIPEHHQLPFKKTKTLIAKCMDQCSQEQNLKGAFDILAQKVQEYFYVPTFRKKTKVPKSSQRKRLEKKRRRAQLKQDRKSINLK